MTTTETCDRQVGPYRIERELGRGGMGVVYLATRSDQEYRKQVAIKLIHGHRGDDIASRFRAERQILANLEHPNIARLLDGGTTPEGDPYLAMEYVRDGLPIDVWCRRNSVPLRVKLEKFQAVCSAVQHAHQHLIVHRDLKPGNMLITPEGDVKLLDFGIARPLLPLTRDLAAASSSATANQMTPDYASPEQLLGHSVGTSSDIYSLGVVLYEMLVGNRPYSSSMPSSPSIWSIASAHEKSVYHGDALTLDRMPASIPSDLASIILMALRENPERRYGSASEFGRDIERFMDGRAVVAHPNHFFYRTSKVVGRNKLAIAATMLLLTSLAAGILTTTEQARLADVRAHDAERHRLEAEQERARAVEQRDHTMKLATTLIVDIDSSIARLAGSLPTRKLLVIRAIEALEHVYRSSPDDPRVLIELATSHQSLGQIQRSQFASSLGDKEGALKSYSRSLELAQRADAIVSKAPNRAVRDVTSDVVAGALAKSYFGIGDQSAIDGDHAKALEYYLKAIPYAERNALGRPQSEPPPDTLAHRRVLASAYKKAGDMYLALNQYREAESCFVKAGEATDKALREFPQDPTGAGDQMVAAISFGQLYEGRGKHNTEPGAFAKALTYYERAERLGEQALAIDPSDASLKRSLFVVYAHTGMLKDELEHVEEAHKDFEKAMTIAEERYKSENGNLLALYDMADSHFNLSHTFNAMGKKEDARKHLNASLDFAHRAAALAPDTHQTKFSLQRVEEARKKL